MSWTDRERPQAAWPPEHGQFVQAELAEPHEPRPPLWRRGRVQFILFLLTCWTTYSVGERMFGNGLWYAVPLLATLLCHEFGHYLQAVRYKVPASLPYFIPIPVPPLGTMGAVIVMRGNMGNRRSLYDIGISGPLAGLVPATIFSVIGLSLSEFVPLPAHPTGEFGVGQPLFFGFLKSWVVGPTPAGHTVSLHPMAYAGWVGVFITALNLFPISQLDGGHVLYALLRRKSHAVATTVLLAAIVGVVLTRNYMWFPMLFLLVLVGPHHPPTGDDNIPLGTTRTILGWLTLSFVIFGFTPTPFRF